MSRKVVTVHGSSCEQPCAGDKSDLKNFQENYSHQLDRILGKPLGLDSTSLWRWERPSIFLQKTACSTRERLRFVHQSDAVSRVNGYGPGGGRLQSHHSLQQEWAAQNLGRHGYDPSLAPTVTIETGQGFPHSTISALQNARRDARVAAGKGKWSSTLDEELRYIVSDFRAVGFGDDVIKRVLEQQYKMLDKLGVKFNRVPGF